ncbi:uncharacterized protein DUF998 [Stackebrandtia endophytica]|uniref:Uncharacterized protein DUF998 n=1 Tax=Stackebrandtia endophytica TaxID=1496996 RepID=A0A543AXL8_9ACTN|nr:DUF998 domain-containing protein [Stackebrandtia endophytica]TQL77324.1 uncharacterized protein DUF998 [Stackebrandtia endophytica]
MVPYLLMGVTGVVALTAAWRLRGWKSAAIVGAVAWLPQIAYFGIEVIVGNAVTQPYDPLLQPMSDLGITTCGIDTYPLADRAICSPRHMLMNWTMSVSGTMTAAGALLLRSQFPRGRRVTAAMWLLVVFGVSNTLAGAIPADLGFTWHVLVSIPGMVVQIPALFLMGAALWKDSPRTAAWSHLCGAVAALSLALLMVQPVLELPGGLLQRTLYGAVFLWCTGVAIAVLSGARRR